ncbi:MAG: sodium-dependent transporter [Thermococcus sp.]|nr:sodium-dependent transporter [Thermococcus sp.]
MRKMSTLMALLITGYVLGVLNFLLMPKYYIAFGLKGFVLSLGALAIGLVLIYSEFEATRRTRYLIHEFMVKVSRLPAVTIILLMFLMLLGAVNLYYSGFALLKLLNTSTTVLPIILLMIIALIWLFLIILRGRSVEFIGALAVLFIVFAFISLFLMRGQVYDFVTSDTALEQLNSYRDAVFSFDHSLTVKGVVLMLTTVLLSLGLGAGVYYVLGSFAPSEMDFKKLLAVIVLLQILLSFTAAFTTVYSIGAAYQSYENNQVRFRQVRAELQNILLNQSQDPSSSEAAMEKYRQLQGVLNEINQTLNNFHKVQRYASVGDENPIEAIETFYLIPDIIRESGIRGSSAIIFLLMGSIFLAGFTTLIVLVEIGAQISIEAFQMSRNVGVSFISGIIFVLSAAMIVSDIKVMLLSAVLSVGGLVIALEGVPLLVGVSPVDKRPIMVGVAVSALIGLLTLWTMLGFPDSYVKLGVVVGLLLLLPLIFNNYLMVGSRSGR